MSIYSPIIALSPLPEFDNPVKLAVVGDRTYMDYLQLQQYLVFLCMTYDIRYIVSGGRRKDGRGVDTLAENWADNCQYDKIIFPPKTKYKNVFQAFFDRNQQIANTANMVFALKETLTGGTKDTVVRALKLNKIVLWGNYKNEIQWVKSLT